MSARSLNRRLLIVLLLVAALESVSSSQEPKPQGDRGLGVRPTPRAETSIQTAATGKPEIVLQAGITSPQTQIAFSPDGRLLASMGVSGSSIKLWEVATGRLLRELESAIPSLGGSSMTRPFRFSADGKTIIGFADGRIRRWEVETGRELNNTPLADAKSTFNAFMSDDGRTVAALNLTSSVIKLWDATSGREVRSLSFDDEESLADQGAIALSPSGDMVVAFIESVRVSGSRKSMAMETSRSIAIWEAATGRRTRTLKVASSSPQLVSGSSSAIVPVSIGFSCDGSWLALREHGSMRIWEVATGRELQTFASPRIAVDQDKLALAMFASKFTFSPDRRFVSFVTDGNKIDIFDTSSNATLHRLSGHAGPVLSMSFSTDGKLLASSGGDNQIKLWDVATARELRALSGAAMPLSDIAISRDGRSLTLAGQQTVTSWELPTGGVRRTLSMPDDYSKARQESMFERAGVLSPNGELMIAGSATAPSAKIWDTRSGRELTALSLTQGKGLGSAVFSSDGRLVALTEREMQAPGRPSPQPQPQSPAATPTQPPAGVAIPDITKLMEQMRKDPKKMEETMRKAQEAMRKGDLSAGMSALDSLGIMTPASKPKSANSLRILDVSSGRQLQSIPLPGGFFNEATAKTSLSNSVVSFSPDGQTLASATGYAAPIVIRDANTGQELHTLKALLTMGTYSFAWSADGRRLASAHWGFKRNIYADPGAADSLTFEDMSFSIKVWDAQTGTEIKSLVGHNNFIHSLVFSPDGRFLASGGYDSTVKLWDLATGAESRTLVGHTGSIMDLEFSPDGRFVVSASDDGSVRLWNSQTGELLATLVSLNNGDDWLVVTPDGLFDGSPGGWSQILWRFSSNIYDVSPVEIFFNEFFRPGLLPDILAGKKVAATVDISQRDRRQPKLSLELSDAGPGTNIAARQANVRIKITEANAGARDVRLFRNGSLVKVWRGDVLRDQPTTALEAAVTISAGRNQLTAYAFNRDNVKSSDALLTLEGAASLRRSGTLHLLAIGLNQYANAGYNLKYAVADARAFVEEVERQQRKVNNYSEIQITTLLDRDATKANLLHALRRLAGNPDQKPAGSPAELERITAAQPEDAVVVFYAGHGTAQGQRFYLIPHDLGYEGPRTELDEAGLSRILMHSVSDLELEQAWEGIDAGHMLLVIDACNSGQALEAEEKRRGPMNSKGLAQLAYEKGLYILTAAQSYQAALEAEQLGHGYLTFALVEEGLKLTAADNQPKDSQVVLREWLDYATERVPRMQEAKMKEARGLKAKLAFVEGEDKVEEVEKRSLQRPRVFYRREVETKPLVMSRP